MVRVRCTSQTWSKTGRTWVSGTGRASAERLRFQGRSKSVPAKKLCHAFAPAQDSGTAACGPGLGRVWITYVHIIITIMHAAQTVTCMSVFSCIGVAWRTVAPPPSVAAAAAAAAAGWDGCRRDGAAPCALRAAATTRQARQRLSLPQLKTFVRDGSQPRAIRRGRAVYELADATQGGIERQRAKQWGNGRFGSASYAEAAATAQASQSLTADTTHSDRHSPEQQVVGLPGGHRRQRLAQAFSRSARVRGRRRPAQGRARLRPPVRVQSELRVCRGRQPMSSMHGAGLQHTLGFSCPATPAKVVERTGLTHMRASPSARRHHAEAGSNSPALFMGVSVNNTKG